MQDIFVTPEPEKPSQVLASRWSRLGAALIDWFIGVIVSSPIIAVRILLVLELRKSPFERHETLDYAALLAIGFVAAIALLLLQCVLLTKDGQTIGKKIVGIRIVNVDTGENGGFVPNVLLRSIVNGLISYFTCNIYGIVDVLFIFRDDRRCIHDLIAGTRVIEGKPQHQSSLSVWERYNKAGGTDSGAL